MAFQFAVAVRNAMLDAITAAIDGGAFGALTNAVAEISNGVYSVDLAAPRAGDAITLTLPTVGVERTYAVRAAERDDSGQHWRLTLGS